MKSEQAEAYNQLIQQLFRMHKTRTVPEIERELFGTSHLKDEMRDV